MLSSEKIPEAVSPENSHRPVASEVVESSYDGVRSDINRKTASQINGLIEGGSGTIFTT